MTEYKPKLPLPLYFCMVSGLQMLLALRLKGCPSTDTADAMFRAWDTALSYGKKWDEKADEPRFEKCFLMLSAEMHTWPAPADFLAKLPKRETPEHLQLEHDFKPTDEQRIKAGEEIAKIKKLLANAPVMSRDWMHGERSRSVEECIAIHRSKQRSKMT